MKLIIAGSRGISEKETVTTAFEQSPYEWEDITEIVSGTANGVDSIGESLAEEKDIPVKEFSPDSYMDEAPNPKVAPLLRNGAMAEYSDALLAVWDGESTGTEDMITKAKREDLQISIYRTDTHGLGSFL